MSRTTARCHIVNRFVAPGATVPDRAIAFVAGDAATARLFQRLRRHGALVEAAPGRFWLDPERLHGFRLAVRRQAATWAAALGLLATFATTATAILIGE